VMAVKKMKERLEKSVSPDQQYEAQKLLNSRFVDLTTPVSDTFLDEPQTPSSPTKVTLKRTRTMKEFPEILTQLSDVEDDEEVCDITGELDDEVDVLKPSVLPTMISGEGIKRQKLKEAEARANELGRLKGDMLAAIVCFWSGIKLDRSLLQSDKDMLQFMSNYITHDEGMSAAIDEICAEAYGEYGVLRDGKYSIHCELKKEK
jgi:hypothetical protein